MQPKMYSPDLLLLPALQEESEPSKWKITSITSKKKLGSLSGEKTSVKSDLDEVWGIILFIHKACKIHEQKHTRFSQIIKWDKKEFSARKLDCNLDNFYSIEHARKQNYSFENFSIYRTCTGIKLLRTMQILDFL